MRPTILKVLCTVSLLSVSVPAPAEDQGGQKTHSLDEIAIELSHPASSLISLRNDFEFRTYDGNLPGARDQDSWRYVLTPSFPVSLGNGRTLLFRGTVPLNADQPLYRVGDTQYSEWMIRQYADVLPRDRAFISGHDHLDDIGLDIAYGGVGPEGLIGMIGLKVVLPTSQDFSSARDQWLLGPEFVLGKQAEWGVIGATVNHLTDVSGETAYSTNISGLKLFFAWGLGNGWQIISNPNIEYDWEAASDNRLSLPVGGGVSKTVRIGGLPLKMDTELYNYVESPEGFGPEWQFSFTLTPVL